jgi:hypothetical protein
MLGRRRLRFLADALRELDAGIAGRVLLKADVVEQQPQDDEVELHRPRLQLRRELGDPRGDVVGPKVFRNSGAEPRGDLLQDRRVVPLRVRVDVDPRGEELIGPTAEVHTRAIGGEQRQRLSGVATGGELARDKRLAELRLPQRSESSSVLDWPVAAAAAIAHVEALGTRRRSPSPDRQGRHQYATRVK